MMRGSVNKPFAELDTPKAVAVVDRLVGIFSSKSL